jgi:hypothetical protein
MSKIGLPKIPGLAGKSTGLPRLANQGRVPNNPSTSAGTIPRLPTLDGENISAQEGMGRLTTMPKSLDTGDAPTIKLKSMVPLPPWKQGG